MLLPHDSTYITAIMTKLPNMPQRPLETIRQKYSVTLRNTRALPLQKIVVLLM